jgi:hypothetical protein
MADDKFIKALTEFINEWTDDGEKISVGNMYGSRDPTIAVYINGLLAEPTEDGRCTVSRPEKEK